MNETSPDTIIQQLMENVTHIISAAIDDQTEKFTDLTTRQQALTKVLNQSEGLSPALLEGLHTLLNKAIDTIRLRMDFEHDNIVAAGAKKKVLRAYGTVNVAAPFERRQLRTIKPFFNI